MFPLLQLAIYVPCLIFGWLQYTSLEKKKIYMSELLTILHYRKEPASQPAERNRAGKKEISTLGAHREVQNFHDPGLYLALAPLMSGS